MLKKVKVPKDQLEKRSTTKTEYFLWLAFAIIVFVRLGFQYVTYFNTDIGVCPEDYSFPSKELEGYPFLTSSISDELMGACYFAQGYTEGTEMFLRAAKLANATVLSLPVVDDLSTKVAVLRGHPERFLVHLSGTHGVEAYAGSAIQSAALQSLAVNADYDYSQVDPVTTELPTIIFVHAVNPYGFFYNRRTNEDNVDVNRNYLTDAEFDFVTRRDPNFAGYVDLDYLINPTSKYFGNWHMLNFAASLVQMGVAALKNGGGISFIKRAMVSGNYHKQTGYGYGGQARSKSVKNLEMLLMNAAAGAAEQGFFDLPHQARRLALIDVHTGLGPMGVDTALTFVHHLNAEPKETEAEQSFIPASRGCGEEGRSVCRKSLASVHPMEVHPGGSITGGIQEAGAEESAHAMSSPENVGRTQKEAASVASDVSGGYEFTVGVIGANFCEALAPSLSKDDRSCLTQEFGTLPPIFVGDAALGENYAHFYGNEEQKAHYGRKMKDAFYVQTRGWKFNVVRRGLKTFYEALTTL